MKEREQLEEAIAALDAQRGRVGEEVVATVLRPMRERLAALAGRALLFTDVVDSTLLVERLGDARAAEVWGEHDRRARELLARYPGREIDRTDGFFLLFDDAADATCYALAYHQVLSDLGLKARAGLNVGLVTLHENAPDAIARGAKRTEVEGLAKPLAARVMALACGGQTLLTAAARTALRDTLPEGAEVESHGHYRFKGVEAPLEVFELGVRGFSPFSPPTDADKAYRVVRAGDLWRPVREVRHNLPAERDTFVGRTTELRALAQRLDGGARLLTLLGTGGTGKTRLVRRYGWTWLGDWPGGIYFCDLSEARSLDGIFFTVAAALEVPPGQDDPGLQLGHAIAARGRCLVILDNFEQVLEHAAATLGRGVDRAADATFIVTSRERLHLSGEEILPIEPLPLNKEAIDLFAARALAQKPDFVISDANHAAVAEVVRLLDGLPLAIELAAARVRVLSPSQLVERLRDRFHLLSGARGGAARQATLKAAIDWSWDLLAPWEQAAFAQCAVFEGGFALEAAEAVLDLSPWPEAFSAIDAVQALVDKSLLRTWVHAEQGRSDIEEPYFGMYVSIHDYAAEKLKASGPEAERAAEERHGRYFAGFGTEEALEALVRHGGVRRRRALALELDNLVAACRRAVGRDDAYTAVGAYRAVWPVLEVLGPIALGEALGAQVLALGIDASLRAAALLTRGQTSRQARRMEEATMWLEQALVLSREVRDRRQEGKVLGYLGAVRREQARMEEARAYFEQALAINREGGDRRMEGFVLGSLGFLHAALGPMEKARTYYEQALAILREVGDRRFEGIILANLGSLHYYQGRTEEARTHYAQALAITREVGSRSGLLLLSLGDQHRDQGRMEEANTHYESALGMIRETGDRRAEGMVLSSVADLLILQGRIDEANEALSTGEAILREVGLPLELAELLCTRGQAEVATGDLGAARTTLAEAETLMAAIGAGPDSELGREIAKLRVALA